jgi:hypothetical protein
MEGSFSTTKYELVKWCVSLARCIKDEYISGSVLKRFMFILLGSVLIQNNGLGYK